MACRSPDLWAGMCRAMGPSDLWSGKCRAMGSSAAEVELIDLPLSTYCLRSRWMLSYHDIPFTKTVYTPVLGEPWLRFKAGKLLSWERVSSPLLVTQRDGGGLPADGTSCWAAWRARINHPCIVPVQARSAIPWTLHSGLMTTATGTMG